jgi:hypothetical protein
MLVAWDRIPDLLLKLLQRPNSLPLGTSASQLFQYEEINYSIWVVMHILGLC